MADGSLLQAALDYAARGWPVSPLCWPTPYGQCGCGWNHQGKNIAKAPHTPQGLKDATTNAATIQGWWGQWPDANIALALEPSGLLDIAPDSPDWLERFQKRGLPRTACFQSGGGEGHRHYLYQRPDGCPPHLICRSGEYDLLSKGYCVAPPSRHASGKRYAWLVPPSEFAPGLPQAPDWAVALLRPHPQTPSPSPMERGQGVRPPVRLSRLGLAYWSGARFKQTETGFLDRSATLYAIAVHLAQAGASLETVAAALENRDVALGFKKYSDRRGDTEYRRVAGKALEVAVRGTSPAGPDGAILSDAYRNRVVSETFSLLVRTARELGAATPEEPDWLVEGYVARGTVTLLSGKPKSAGKTTLTLHLIAAMQNGTPFLGFATKPGRVLYLTEERPATFREGLSRTGLINSQDVLVVSWAEAPRGATWPAIVDSAVKIALENQVILLVIDSLAQWADLKGDSENNSGAALDAMKPLQSAAAKNLAVLAIDHDRKSGGAVGESNRGSGAKVGSADIVVDLQRPSGGENVSNRRELHGISRFDRTPGKLVIELLDGVYRALGAASAVAVTDAMAHLREHLPGSEEDALTEKEIMDGVGVRFGRTIIRQALTNLQESQEATRIGAGKKGAPLRYFLSETTLSL